jgi:uncharacterized protein YeaO (DUF488 family)
MSAIALKSAYAKAEQTDGQRILIDRLWPRGVSKEQLKLAAWRKELAPSNELRQWFRHDPARWEEFRRRYFAELAAREELVTEFIGQIGKGPVTLIFAAGDQQHNNAVALRDYLEEKMTI